MHSVFLSVYLSVDSCLSFYLRSRAWLSQVLPKVFLSVCPCLCLYISIHCLVTWGPTHNLSVYLSIFLSLSIRLIISGHPHCLSVFLSIFLSPSPHLIITSPPHSLSVCLSVYWESATNTQRLTSVIDRQNYPWPKIARSIDDGIKRAIFQGWRKSRCSRK